MIYVAWTIIVLSGFAVLWLMSRDWEGSIFALMFAAGGLAWITAFVLAATFIITGQFPWGPVP